MCFLCSMLRDGQPPVAGNPTPIEYPLKDQDTLLETEDPTSHCSLLRLVRDLRQIWCKSGEGTLGRYFFSCGPENYSICTEPSMSSRAPYLNRQITKKKQKKAHKKKLPASSQAYVEPDPLSAATLA